MKTKLKTSRECHCCLHPLEFTCCAVAILTALKQFQLYKPFGRERQLRAVNFNFYKLYITKYNTVEAVYILFPPTPTHFLP